MRNDDIPKTKSSSSATRSNMDAPGEDNRAGRITESNKTGVLGDRPIDVSTEVKVKNFTSPTRIMDGYETKDDDEQGNAFLDGQNEIMPADAPKKTFINTQFSIK